MYWAGVVLAVQTVKTAWPRSVRYSKLPVSASSHIRPTLCRLVKVHVADCLQYFGGQADSQWKMEIEIPSVHQPEDTAPSLVQPMQGTVSASETS
jgi:hypothetical protein